MDLAERTHHTTRRHPWEIARSAMIQRILKSCINKQSKIRVLDIGCGDGFLLTDIAHAFPLGCFDGVDINFSEKDIQKLSTERVRFHQTPPTTASPYGLILLLDVLEHIEDPSHFLRSIASQYASDKTIFLISVPAYQRLFSSHDQYLKHYRRYDRQELKQLIINAGLFSGPSGSMFFSLLFPRLLQCIYERFSSSRENAFVGLGQWHYGKTFTNIVTGIFNADNACLWHLNKSGISAPGLSLWTIAKLKI